MRAEVAGMKELQAVLVQFDGLSTATDLFFPRRSGNSTPALSPQTQHPHPPLAPPQPQVQIGKKSEKENLQVPSSNRFEHASCKAHQVVRNTTPSLMGSFHASSMGPFNASSMGSFNASSMSSFNTSSMGSFNTPLLRAVAAS